MKLLQLLTVGYVAAGMFCVSAADEYNVNILPDPGFESAKNEGWSFPTHWKTADGVGRNGSRGLVYENETEPKYYGFPARRLNAKPGVAYRIAAWVRTENFRNSDGTAISSRGATICLEWYDKKGKWICGDYPNGVRTKNGDWTKIEVITQRMPPEVGTMKVSPLICRGAYGRAYWDDLEVSEVHAPPISILATDCYRDTACDADKSVRLMAGLCSAEFTGGLGGAVADFHLPDGSSVRAAIKGEWATVEIPVTRLPMGAHEVKFAIRTPGGKPISKSFTVTRIAEWPKETVHFDRHRRVIVDGKPFFVLGMYFGDVTEKDIAKFSKGPFNCIMPYNSPSKAMMDVCQKYGIKVIYSVKDCWYGHRKNLKSEADETAWITARASFVTNHPATLAWYVNDEFSLKWEPRLTNRRVLMHALDPNHPCWSVIYQYGSIRDYMPTFDVIGTDPYPPPGGDLQRPIVWMRETERQTHKSRPVWQVSLASDGGAYEKDRKKQLATPVHTKDEFRNMIWQGLAEGADGIFTYSWFDIQRMGFKRNSDEAFAEISDIGFEVKKFADVFLTDEAPVAWSVPANTDPTLAFRTWKYHGKTYLLALNAGKDSATVTVRLADKFVQAKTLVGEDRFWKQDAPDAVTFTLPHAAVSFVCLETSHFNRTETLKWFTENFYGEPNAEAIAKAQVKPEILYPEGASAEHPVPVIIHGDHNRMDINGRACQPDVPTNAILRRGYALVHYNFNDVAPNVYSRYVNGKIVPTDPKKPYPVQPTLASWAWGFSRVIDQLEKDPRIDIKKIVSIGHSRGGKTSLWAAANDERITLAVSSGSGAGGARYFHHKNERAESIKFMVSQVLPHWFTPKYAEWADREQELPHDADDLLKCIYPRAVYVMSGEADAWADPLGEQIARQRASELWTGKLAGHIGGHVRSGKHALASSDWMKMLDFADNVFGINRMVTPESQGVSSKGIREWIDEIEKRFGGVHGFVIRRHGKVIAEGSFAPYDPLNEPHMLWSHSKSFTATAIGFLADENKLDIDERIVDIFPDKLPANPSENLKQVRVRDLLTMNLGSKKTDAEKDDIAGDWEKAILANAIEIKPGTKFKYNSGATYLLACIVERRSGKKLMDYLKEKLFDPIGIEKAWSSVSPSGTACGGWGMNMTTREIARFGQFLLDGGRWNTRELMSEGWVNMSTGYQTHSWQILGLGLAGGRDWDRGYGFQFWRSRYGYRADGAYGQYTLVIPEKDAVVSLHVGPAHAAPQVELESVWDYLIPAMLDEPLEENPKELAKLRERCASLTTKAVENVAEAKTDSRLFGVDYKLDKNLRGFKSLRLEQANGGKWILKLAAPAKENVFEVGRGEWKRSGAIYDDIPYEPLWGMQGERTTAVSGGVAKDGAVVIQMRPVTTTSIFDFKFAISNNVPVVTGEHRGMGGCKFSGKAAE